MFAYLLEKLGNWLERGAQHRRDEYLASASDLGELECRMRSADRNEYPR
jgi:hypothetical protein